MVLAAPTRRVEILSPTITISMSNNIFSVYKDNQDTSLRLKAFRNKGETTDVDIEYSEEFLENAAEEVGKDELSREEFSEYIAEIIEKSIHGRDGYEMKTESV